MFKDNAFDYADLLRWISPDLENYTWLVFIPIVVFIIMAVSNGANLTDGIDGLAAFTLLIKDEVLNDGSKARIQDEVKEQMTGFGV